MSAKNINRNELRDALSALLNSSTPNRVEKGQDLAIAGKVNISSDVSPTIKAEVESSSKSSTRRTYKVEIKLNPNTKRIGATCSCPDHSHRKAICKHIVAAAFEISHSALGDYNAIPNNDTTDWRVVPISEVDEFEIEETDIIAVETENGYYYDIKVPPFDMFATDLLRTLLTETNRNVNVLLIGPAGSGKNMLVEVVAELLGRKVYSIATYEDLNEEHLFGSFVPTGDGKFEWKDGVVTKAVREGAILLIDEINARPAIFSLHALLDHRREIYIPVLGETIKAHPDFRVIATMNEGYTGTFQLNEALRSRFYEIHIPYSTEIDKAILSDSGLPEKAIKKYIKFIEGLRKSYEEGVIATPPSYRLTREFAQTYSLFGEQVAYRYLIQKLPPEEAEAIRQVLEVIKDA